MWLSEPRITGKKTLHIEIYFAVDTSMRLWEIIEQDISQLKKDRVRVEEKRTRNEHTNKVGFLTGPIVEKANMESYDKIVKYFGELEEGEVELKKKMVYDGPEEEWCITMYSVRLAIE